jgi:hypothetical protein
MASSLGIHRAAPLVTAWTIGSEQEHFWTGPPVSMAGREGEIDLAEMRGRSIDFGRKDDARDSGVARPILPLICH